MYNGFFEIRVPTGWEAGLEVEYFPEGTKKIRGWGRKGKIVTVHPPQPYTDWQLLTIQLDKGGEMIVDANRLICLTDYKEEPKSYIINNASLILSGIFSYKFPHDFEAVRTNDTIVFLQDSYFGLYSGHTPYKVMKAFPATGKEYFIIQTLTTFVEIHYAAGIEMSDSNYTP